MLSYNAGMRAWILLVVASCDSGGPAPKSPVSPPAPVAVAAPPGDATIPDADVVPVDAAPAAPEVDVRASVRAAAPWIAQMNLYEPKLGEETHVTYELRRDGDQALLIGGSSSAGPKEWRLSVVERGKKLIFSPLDGSHKPLPIVECTRTTLAVVRADAELDVKNEDDCGSEPFWKPKTTKRVSVLSCSDDLAFAAAPGIEWYYMHGDCFQGGGWRALPTQ